MPRVEDRQKGVRRNTLFTRYIPTPHHRGLASLLAHRGVHGRETRGRQEGERELGEGAWVEIES